MSSILIMSGVVSEGDAYRCGDTHYGAVHGAVHIGDEDVVERVGHVFAEKTSVIVGVMDEKFDGDLFIETGWGYSEYTPMDSDKLTVGEHDLIDILLRHEGKNVTLVVSTEPVDLFAIVETLS